MALWDEIALTTDGRFGDRVAPETMLVSDFSTGGVLCLHQSEPYHPDDRSAESLCDTGENHDPIFACLHEHGLGRYQGDLTQEQRDPPVAVKLGEMSDRRGR